MFDNHSYSMQLWGIKLGNMLELKPAPDPPDIALIYAEISHASIIGTAKDTASIQHPAKHLAAADIVNRLSSLWEGQVSAWLEVPLPGGVIFTDGSLSPFDLLSYR